MSEGFRSAAVSIAAAVLLSACGGEGSNDDNRNGAESLTLDQKVSAVAKINGITGDPTTGRTLPSITDPKARLGMQLFFSKALGGDLDSACVSCHHPLLGGGDNLSLSIGVEAVLPDLLGPGREHRMDGHEYDGGPTVPRNAPSTFNIVFYDEVLFHDGRVESLDKANPNGEGDAIRTPDSAFGVADVNAGANLSAAQARFPVTSPEEMRGHTFQAGTTTAALRTALEERLKGEDMEMALTAMNDWLSAFQTGFADPMGVADDLITYDHIADALAAYQNSQVLVDNPWKDYLAGDTKAISDDAKRGALLFYTPVAKGGAGCSGCHSGDFFTDEQFHVVGMPQVGRGKGDGVVEPHDNDYGRFRETKEDDDKFAFRTPHLLNVAKTGPWGHAGAYTSLEAVVRHHLNPQLAFDNYDLSQLAPFVQTDNIVLNTQQALDQLAALRLAGKSKLVNADLTDVQVSQLLAFLNALTDPCLDDRDCMAKWIPGDDVPDPDGLRVKALGTL